MQTIDSDLLTKKQSELRAKSCLDKKNMSYVVGDNYSIKAANDVLPPDNRIPIPLAQSSVTNIIGYAGRPGQIKTDYELAEAIIVDDAEIFSDEITEKLNGWDLYNNEGIENSELMAQSLAIGDAFELWWVSRDEKTDKMRPDYKILPFNECCPIYDGSLKPKMTAFIRFYENDDKVDIADVYYPRYSERWVSKKNGTSTGTSWEREPEGDTEYPYNRVPVIKYKTSRLSLPIFNAQKPIMDAIDQLVSKTQNEVDRFNALIMLFPGIADKDFIQALTDAAKPYIDNLDQYDPGMWPQYLEKNLSGVNQFYNDQADRLERLYHKTSNIPDMSDEQFVGAQSGVAIAYKLIGFEFLVSEIEVYFRMGLAERFDLYFDFIENAAESNLANIRDKYTQRISWKRNIPVDDAAKVQIAAAMMGLGISKETILNFLPSSIIADAKKELERMEAESADDVDINTDDGTTD